MLVQKSAEAIVGAGTDRRAERGRTRVGGGISMKLMKTQARPGGGAHTEEAGRYPASAVLRVETESASHLRTKAEEKRESCLMEAVVNRDNLMAAYQRVVRNKGAAGVDGIGVAQFKDHLKQYWPTIKAKLLAGEYIPQPVRRVDIPKPQGGVRTLGIPTLTDRLIQQALHQVLQPIFEVEFSRSSYGFVRVAHPSLRSGPAFGCPAPFGLVGRDGMRIRRSRRRSGMSPKADVWWRTWTWRNSLTGSTTTS
jgi:hypothetical protein